MNGPEHYREAERELTRAFHVPDAEAFHLGVAQVHATLALAAATLDVGHLTVEGARAWEDAGAVR